MYSEGNEMIDKKVFNLKKHRKQALYEGSQEQMRSERRQMDRQKKYLDEGMSAHDAWQKSQDEYDKKEG